MEAVEEVAPREITVPDGSIWLGNSVVATRKVTTDVLLIKQILRDIQITVECASLLGDNRVLLTFSSQAQKNSFLAMIDYFHDFFSDIKIWDEDQNVSKRFLWINVYGIPLHFWSLDLFKEIGKECGEFISLAEATFTRSRMDMATMLISSSLAPSQNSSILSSMVRLLD